jgi:hypothetical protein
MEMLKGRRSKTGVMTSFVTGDEMLDVISNTIYQLHDSLLQRISARQWQTIKVLAETSAVERAAKRMGRDKSTVSRSLRRGFWWQMEETRTAMERIIEGYMPVVR